MAIRQKRKPRSLPVQLGRQTDAGHVLPAPRDYKVWSLFHIWGLRHGAVWYYQVMRDRDTRLWWVRCGTLTVGVWEELHRFPVHYEIGRKIWERICRSKARREVLIPYSQVAPDIPDLLRTYESLEAAREPALTPDDLAQYASGVEYEIPFNGWAYQQLMAVCRTQGWKFRASCLALDKSKPFRFRIER